MTMKRFLYAMLLFAAAALLLPACSKDATEPETPPATAGVLKASPAAFDFTAEGGSLDITVEASAQWNLSGTEWCYALVSTGTKGTTATKIYAAPYTGSEPRTAVLRLSSAGMSDVEITVRQAAREADQTRVVAEPAAWDNQRRGEMVYQLLVYSFADSDGDGMGDFRGIISKMDYIDELGAAAIWLSPIHPADSYHGYDVIDYAAVNPDYGTEADFKALIDEAHSRGIKIYLDYVMNHTGKSHPWFIDACSSTASPYRDWYIFSQNPDADVKAGKFPMIDRNKVEGGWYSAPVISGGDRPVRYKFVLDASNAASLRLTVTETDEAVTTDNTDASVNYYLYCGDPAANTRFRAAGENRYELVVDYRSPWGFLIRTSATSWDGGTKWGAPSKTARVVLGQPFALDNKTAADILFEYMETWQFYSACYTDWMPDLNYGAISSFRDSGPYREILASVKKWIDFGIDGLRLDMAKHIYSNPDSSENPTFWKGFYDDVNAYFRQSHTTDFYMVGEVFSGVDQVVNYTTALSCFNFDFWGWGGESNLSNAVKNGRGRNIAANLVALQQRLTAKNPDYIDALILSNHDMNRASEAFGGNVDRCRMAGVILATLTGRPYVYYGEELAYRGIKDNKGDEYVRQPMAWGDSYTTRYKPDIAWPSTETVAALSADPASILNAYRTFGTLRNIYPALTEQGAITPCDALYAGAAGKLDAIGAWYRTSESERLLVLHNLGSARLSFDLPETPGKAVAVWGEVLLDGATLTMPGFSSVIFEISE